MIGLNIKVDVYRLTTTWDAAWNVDKISYPDLPTYRNVRARIVTLRAEQKESLQAIGINISTTAVHGICFNAGEDVQIKDHIEYDGKTYEVVSIDDVDKDAVHLEGVIVFWQGVVKN